MIQNILLPEKIGSYYLFGKRTIGIEITKTHVYATVAYFKASTVTVEQYIESLIDQTSGDSATARTAVALKKVLALAGKYDEIRFAISAAQVIFKTMQLPFNEVEKIKKVIDFEVEPLLPFSITESVIDFIITKTYPNQQTCEVLIAAAQKQYLSQQLEVFSQAGVLPESVTVDLFELFGLYSLIGQASDEQVALVQITEDITKIVYVAEGRLRFLRTLPFTINQQNKFEPEALAEQQTDAQKNEPFNNAKTFADNLLFTLQSFTSQSQSASQLPKLYLLGAGATIAGIVPWLQEATGMEVAIFNPTQITEHAHIQLKTSPIPSANIISTATAISSPTTEHVNLRQKEFAPSGEKLLIKQLMCAAFLLVSLFVALFTHSFLEKRALHKELTSSKNETLDIIGQWYPAIDKGSIDDMLEEAESETKKDERTWFAFARSAHNSLLNLLLELTKINREGLGLIVEKITIDQERGLMNLSARVKDHDALARLENELRQSKLFSYVQPQNDINFTMELRFAGERDGES